MAAEILASQPGPSGDKARNAIHAQVAKKLRINPLVKEAMEEAFKLLELPVENFQRPDGLAEVPGCGPSGCASDLVPSERAPRAAPTPVRR